MAENTYIGYLESRIRELEEKIRQLRLSRRVLMNLIEKMEKERTGFLNRLEKENHRLHRDNCRYAQRLLYKNLKILELESKLDHAAPGRFTAGTQINEYN